MSKSYYKILEISRNATEYEIRKAYTKLALKYHNEQQSMPDAKAKFKELTDAYDVLVDPIKKSIYDRYTCEDDCNMDTSDGAASSKSYSPGGKRPAPLRQDPPLVRDLLVTLEEVNKGCTKRMKIIRKISIGDGRPSRLEEKTLTIEVKPGWKEGTKISFPQEGDQYPNRIPADLILVVKDDPNHEHFKRDGNDIKYTAKISLLEALCGCSLKIPTLDGPSIPLELTEVISPITVKRLTGMGLPVSKQPGCRGDLVVKFDIVFPEVLPLPTKATKEILRVCLHHK